MKYVIFTFSGEGLPIAEKLQLEGNSVTVAMIREKKDTFLPQEMEAFEDEDPDEKKARLALYDGVLKKFDADRVVRNLKKVKDKSDYFLFFDFNHCFKFAEELRGLGFNGNFPTEEDRKFEVDRDYAKEFVEKHYPDVRVAKNQEFKTIDEFMKVADQMFQDEVWVLKPLSDEARTKVPDSQDPEMAKQEIITALQSNPQGYESEGFILELLIPDAIEITPQKMWYDGVPLYTSVDIEAKRLGSCYGPMTGCAADLVFPVDPQARICQIAFPKAADDLAMNHEGLFVWDISLLYNPHNNKVYMGEFCPNRVGYNAFYTELSLLEYVTDFFEAVAAKKNPMNGAKKFGASFRLFQIREKGKTDGIGITVDPEKMDNLWFIDAKVKEGQPQTCGYIWDVGVATGAGESIEEACHSAYKTAEGALYDHKMIGRSDLDFLSYDQKDSIRMRYGYLMDNKLA